MSLSSLLSKLNIVAKLHTRKICTTQTNLINFTPVLFAEPLKKKKKLDPQVLKQREDRKRKKLEKQIRRLEKNARQLKPIDECEVPLQLLDEKQMRQRPKVVLPVAEVERRAILSKKWARYKMEEKASDYRIISSVMQAQQKALDELRKESEELYQEAIQPDLGLVPFTIQGPVATPRIPDYESPDGEYIGISKKWV